MTPRTLWSLAVLALLLAPGIGHAGLRETAHNLSPSGFARRRAVGQGTGAAVGADGDTDLCIFCHTPHSAAGRRGL